MSTVAGRISFDRITVAPEAPCPMSSGVGF
jgi:hypothetical protein